MVALKNLMRTRLNFGCNILFKKKKMENFSGVFFSILKINNKKTISKKKKFGLKKIFTEKNQICN